MKNYRFCPICKSKLIKTKLGTGFRLVCKNCGWVYYSNPLPSAVVFVRNFDDQVLLIKRAIEPGKGKWALPSGFIEEKEIPEHAALRELKEETNMTGHIDGLIGVYTEFSSIYGNVLLIAYSVAGINGHLRPGSDASQAKFFSAEKLPKIAFGSHLSIIKDGMAKTELKNGFIEVLKSKISEAIVTKAVLYYKGSMGIDSKIMKAANLIPGEKVHVLNYDNGERLETYTIEEKAGSGKIVLYGPASLKGKVGHKLCVLSYMFATYEQAKKVKSRMVIVDRKNRIKKIINVC